jgi:hypothetical protein
VDILDEMTKGELVFFIRGNMFLRNLPRRKEIMFNRYQLKYKKHMDVSDALTKELQGLDMSKRDELARKFNASTDNAERLAILNKMLPYDNAIKSWFKKERENQKQFDELEKEYQRIQQIAD